MRVLIWARWGSAAALGAGVVWLLVWAHQASAHGRTQLNEMNVVLGLTWMDSAKVLPISFGLLLVAVAGLRELRGRPRWLGQAGFVVTGIALVWLAISVAIEFWAFAWGSYELDFDRPLPKYGGLAQTVGSLALAAGFLLLAIDLGRTRVLPLWIGVGLVVGALTTIYLTPVLPIPGLAWLLLGAALWRKSRSKLVPYEP